MFRIYLIIAAIVLSGMVPTLGVAAPPEYSQLDSKPYDPETEPDIDLFLSHWKESMPRHEHGALVVRDIFTPCTGDPLKPVARGAVLTEIKRFSHATLAPGSSTVPAALKDEQEILYIDAGRGTITSGGRTVELYEGVGILMPPNVEFTLTNTGGEPLGMYLIVEPIPEGFKPKKAMVVSDENKNPIGSATGHWCHIHKRLFTREDGLAVLVGMGPVWFDPMTMGQPHSHDEGIEEIWFSLKGASTILLGKELRAFPPGTAYKIPPNAMTPHSTINTGEKAVKVFWFMKSGAHKMLPYSNLDPKPFDPATEPDIDLFFSHWKESMPRHSFGSLIERDIFTPCTGDPMKPAVRGAVLTDIKRFSHGTLEAGASTTPSKLENEQVIFYVDQGRGTVTAGEKTAELYHGVGVLMPPGIEFTMSSTGSRSLTMYVIAEPIPAGFQPKTEMQVRDTNASPIHTSSGHWVHISTRLFTKEDGLATLLGLGPVWFAPMTMGQPHSHPAGVEEIWFSLRGEPTILLGKQLRPFHPGTAYKIPPNGTTPHSTINIADEPVEVFWMMKVPGN